MAAVVSRWRKARPWGLGLRALAMLVLIGVGGFVGVARTSAISYQTNWTGYAYGNQNGSGGPVGQGDFANHPAGSCNDPSGNWQWGTIITLVSLPYITLYQGDNTPMNYSSFTLEDNGDPQCHELSYWADIYFGRNATPTEAGSGCPCSGSPQPGVCYASARSNCQDAINFGRVGVTYDGPP